MEQIIILQGITVEQLLTRIEEMVDKKIAEKMEHKHEMKPIQIHDQKRSSRILTCDFTNPT